ncbi:MFS transporter [Alicyclobacillus acidiphilus]|uniref:MFS transporter n=1 Tax=Alicyclobacillus acidiphilus TaxID=182455 RepID=UPI00082BC2FB|nr:MFS transporter [Alicyclobacillus acidiphilus]
MRTAIICYFASELFLSWGIGVVQYAQPFYYASMHIGDQNIGYLFAVNGIFGGLGAFVAGPVADRVGATRLFKLGTLLIGVGAAATAFFYSLPLWFLATAVSGIGGAMLASTENVVLNLLVTGFEKSHLISRFTAFYMVIIGIGAMSAGWLVPKFGLQSTMIIAAVVTLIAPIIRAFVRASDTRRESLRGLPMKLLTQMAVYAVLFGVAGGLFNPFATLLLSERHHASTAVTSIVYAIGLFMVAVGSYLVRPLLRKMRHGSTLVMSYLLSAAFTVAFVAATTTAAFVGLYFLLTIATAIPQPIVDGLFLDAVSPTEFSQMFGTRVFGTRVGNAIGSSVGGGLLKGNHFDWVMLLSAAMFLIAGLYLGMIRRRRTRPQSDQPVDLSKTRP